MVNYSKCGILFGVSTCHTVVMANSLGDILANRDFDQQAEVRAIKDYVRRNYDSDVSVTVQTHTINVAAKSASLIGSLRMNLPKLQKAADTEKRITFRIG